MPEDNNLNNAGNGGTDSNERQGASPEKPAQSGGAFAAGCIILFVLFIGWGMYKGAVNREEAKKALSAKNIAVSDASVVDSIKKGDLETLRQLLTAGASPDAKGENDSSALILAVMEGKTDMVNALLSAGADVNYKNARGVSALIAAADKNNFQIARMLTDRTAEVNLADNDGNTALIYAAERSNADLVKLLLAKGADPAAKNNKGETALQVAKVDAIRAVLSAAPGAPAVSVPTAAQSATPAAHFAEAEKLSPAAARKKLDDLKVPYNDNRFIEAVVKCETEAVALFIRAGLHPNTKNSDGINSLMAAAREGNIEMMSFLLSKNAGVNAKDKNDATALMMAAEHSKPAAVRLLIEKGAEVNAKDKKGRTALNFAVSEEVKKALLAAGAK